MGYSLLVHSLRYVQSNGAKLKASKLRTMVRMAKRDWIALHGVKYR